VLPALPHLTFSSLSATVTVAASAVFVHHRQSGHCPSAEGAAVFGGRLECREVFFERSTAEILKDPDEVLITRLGNQFVVKLHIRDFSDCPRFGSSGEVSGGFKETQVGVLRDLHSHALELA